MVNYNWGNISENQLTELSNELLLVGSGYFTLNAEDPILGVTGTYFTRSGQFVINANGNIVDHQGYFVRGFSAYETSFVESNLINLTVDMQRAYGQIIVTLPQNAIEGAVVALEWSFDLEPLTQIVTAADLAKGSVAFNGYFFLSPEIATLLSPACYWTQAKINLSQTYTANQVVTIETASGQTWSSAIKTSDLSRGYMLVDLPSMTNDETSALVVKTVIGGVQTPISGANITYSEQSQAPASEYEAVTGVSVLIDSNGVVSELYSDGTQLQIGVLALANFTNESGLQDEGNNIFTATQASGAPAIAIAGSPEAGAVAISIVDHSKLGIISAATAAVYENISPSTVVYAVAAIDPDANATLSYAISGGADANLFDIDTSTGAVTFKTAPDFEAPSDNGADNVYDILVEATDGSLVDTKAVSITVSNVNEGSPGKDFNGDGKGDILLQNVNDGSCFIWELDDKTLINGGFVGWAPGANWQAKATGDFNGDGKSDILLQNVTDGSCFVWELDSKATVDAGFVGWAAGPAWRAKATGDFNGDGKSDILLQNASDGACFVWELDGKNLIDAAFVGWAAGPNWQVKATADFNGDGKSDILLQNATDGACFVWELDGTTLVDSGFVGWAPGPDWQAKATGDFNGDGKSDILLQNANDGACFIWELDDKTLVGGGFVGWAPGRDWQVKAASDFNGDGNSDILLQNVNDGACFVWNLDGTTLVGSGFVGWAPGADWHAAA